MTVVSCFSISQFVAADWSDDFESAQIGDTLGTLGYGGEYAIETVQTVGVGPSKGVLVPVEQAFGWPGAWVFNQPGLVNVGDSLAMSIDVQMEIAEQLVSFQDFTQAFELQLFRGDFMENAFLLAQFGFDTATNFQNYALAEFDSPDGTFDVSPTRPIGELGLTSMAPGEISNFITLELTILKTGNNAYQVVTSLLDTTGSVLATLEKDDAQLDTMFATGNVAIRFGHLGNSTPESLSSLRYDNFNYTVTPASEVTIAPENVIVTRGESVSPSIDLSQLADSDNVDFSLRRSTTDIQSITEFEATFSSPTAVPSSIDIVLEGSVFARTGVTQTIEIFDFVGQTWEELDSRSATRFSDSTVTANYSGDISRVVGTSQEVNIRVRYRSAQARQQFSSNTDQLTVTFGL